MAITVILDNGTSTYTFDPTPAATIENAYEHEDDTAEFRKKHVTWSLSGYLLPAGGAIATQVSALEAFLAGGELLTAVIKDGAVAIEEMPTDNSIKIESVSFPEGQGPEWATKRTFNITLSGVDVNPDIATAGDVVYTITYATDQSGIMTRTINGTLIDQVDQTAAAKYAAYKTAQGWDTWTDAYAISNSYTQDKNDVKCDFTIVHRKYWLVYPNNITNLNVNTEYITDTQNVTKLRLSGWFEGPEADCVLAINQLVAGSGIIVTKRLSRNAWNNRTSFSIEQISPLWIPASGILYFQQQLSIELSVYDFVHKQVLGGSPPIKQLTSRRPVQVVQSGMAKNIRFYPNDPIPLYDSTGIKKYSVTRISPEYAVAAGNYVYGIRWSIQYEFAVFPGWR